MNGMGGRSGVLDRFKELRLYDSQPCRTSLQEEKGDGGQHEIPPILPSSTTLVSIQLLWISEQISPSPTFVALSAFFFVAAASAFKASFCSFSCCLNGHFLLSFSSFWSLLHPLWPLVLHYLYVTTSEQLPLALLFITGSNKLTPDLDQRCLCFNNYLPYYKQSTTTIPADCAKCDLHGIQPSVMRRRSSIVYNTKDGSESILSIYYASNDAYLEDCYGPKSPRCLALLIIRDA